MVALIERAEASMASGKFPPLPEIPPPWIKGNPPPRDHTGSYVRNDRVFLQRLASKTILRAPIEPLLANDQRNAEFLRLAGALLDLTLQEITPPFANRRREHRGHTPYEWVFEYSEWCGKLCAQLTQQEVKDIFLSRIAVGENEAALLIMRNVLRGFMLHGLLWAKEIPDERISLWSEMAEWLFENPEWKKHRSGGHLDGDFLYAAFCILFCAASDFSGLICGVDIGWPHLVRFEKILERAVRECGRQKTLYLAVTTFFKRGGFDLLPDPGLEWIREIVEANKQDQQFWAANGEDTVELLKNLVSKKGQKLSVDHHRAITAISDILIDNGVRGAGFLQQELMRATG
jgi:hypothetical protein